MNKIITLLILAIISSCSSNKEISNKGETNKELNEEKQKYYSNETDNSSNTFFTLIEAKSKKWTAGIPSGGSGTEYYFKIKITTSEKIKFDSAWVNNKAFQLYISKETSVISNKPIEYTNGDIIILRISDIINKQQNLKIARPPIKYNGKALIRYYVNDKRYFYAIKEIEQIKGANRP